MAYTDRGRVNERDTGTFAQAAQLQEDGHWEHYFFVQFSKPVVRYGLGEATLHMLLDVIDIEMF